MVGELRSCEPCCTTKEIKNIEGGKVSIFFSLMPTPIPMKPVRPTLGQTPPQDLPAGLRSEILSPQCLSHTHSSLPTFCDRLLTRVHTQGDSTCHHILEGIDKLLTHMCGQTRAPETFVPRIHLRTSPTCQGAPMQASSLPAWTPGHSLPLCPPHPGLLPFSALSCFQAPAHPPTGHLLNSGPWEEWAGSSFCQSCWAVATCSHRTSMQKHAFFKTKD